MGSSANEMGKAPQGKTSRREVERQAQRRRHMNAPIANPDAKAAFSAALGSAFPPVLDVCCGAKMMWWDKHHPHATYMDKRSGNFTSQHKKLQRVDVSPDVVASFTNIPYPDESFWLVVFDPPHFENLGKNSKIANIYGELLGNWRDDLRAGFRECFRVLKPNGTLIFKWSEMDIAVGEIVALAPQLPLFGHQTRRHGKTHWLAFLKTI